MTNPLIGTYILTKDITLLGIKYPNTIANISQLFKQGLPIKGVISGNYLVFNFDGNNITTDGGAGTTMFQVPFSVLQYQSGVDVSSISNNTNNIQTQLTTDVNNAVNTVKAKHGLGTIIILILIALLILGLLGKI